MRAKTVFLNTSKGNCCCKWERGKSVPLKVGGKTDIFVCLTIVRGSEACEARCEAARHDARQRGTMRGMKKSARHERQKCEALRGMKKSARQMCQWEADTMTDSKI